MDRSILVIEDRPSARQQIHAILKSSRLFSRIDEADDGLKGFKLLLENPADIVLCDLEMPKLDGLKFLCLVNSRKELRDIPVIILTGNEDERTKIKGLEQGASDYLTKPFEPRELIARLNIHLKIKVLQDELKKSNELLRELSITDSLTRLYNRRYLMECLNREFSRSCRGKTSMSLLMADVDHFKEINDTYGHPQGDRVLTALAAELRSHLRSYDIAARFGGEEFAMVLPDTGPAEAAEIAERLRRAAGEMTFSGAPALSMTVSLGISAAPLQGIDTVEDLIREADRALYRAKREGRNRVCTFPEG